MTAAVGLGFAFDHFTILYPIPRTVSIRVRSGLISWIFFRSRLTALSTARTPPTKSYPQAWLSSCSRERTLPLLRTRCWIRSNSSLVSGKGISFIVTVRESSSNTRPEGPFRIAVVGLSWVYFVSAQHGLDPGHQLAHAEWFAEVIISAQFKPDHPVGFLTPGGDHDDRHLAGLAQLPANIQTINFWQHQVQKDQIRVVFFCGSSAASPSWATRTS